MSDSSMCYFCGYPTLNRNRCSLCPEPGKRSPKPAVENNPYANAVVQPKANPNRLSNNPTYPYCVTNLSADNRAYCNPHRETDACRYRNTVAQAIPDYKAKANTAPKAFTLSPVEQQFSDLYEHLELILKRLGKLEQQNQNPERSGNPECRYCTECGLPKWGGPGEWVPLGFCECLW